MIENIVVFTIRLENDYIRFESDFWYKHDKINDAYTRVWQSDWLEAEYQKVLEGHS